jgi:hypothetical protein
MKKINPKVTKLVIMLMTLLIAGGSALAIKEGLGDPDISADSANGENSGAF